MRHIVIGLACACLAALNIAPSATAQDGPTPGFVNKLGEDMDVRSGSRVLANEILSGNVILPELATPVAGGAVVPQIQLRGGNQQVNDPGLDYVQIFAGFRPFVRATQSETSAAAFGRNVVVTYNNSAGIHVSPNPAGSGLIVDRVRNSSSGLLLLRE